jgi:hypothetical protein
MLKDDYISPKVVDKAFSVNCSAGLPQRKGEGGSASGRFGTVAAAVGGRPLQCSALLIVMRCDPGRDLWP